MKSTIRLVVLVTLALGTSGARADHDPYTENAPHPQSETLARDPGDGQATTRAGAGSMEPVQVQVQPRQAVDESPGTSAHDAWVETIWTSP
jgi:hypothetical protein